MPSLFFHREVSLMRSLTRNFTKSTFSHPKSSQLWMTAVSLKASLINLHQFSYCRTVNVFFREGESCTPLVINNIETYCYTSALPLSLLPFILIDSVGLGPVQSLQLDRWMEGGKRACLAVATTYGTHVHLEAAGRGESPSYVLWPDLQLITPLKLLPWSSSDQQSSRNTIFTNFFPKTGNAKHMTLDRLFW